MEVARRTFGRWKPGHKDIGTQIVVERGGAILLRFNTGVDELDEIEQMARDLLHEIGELRADRRRIWLERSRTLPEAQKEESEKDR
jgi:hypothetical protein